MSDTPNGRSDDPRMVSLREFEQRNRDLHDEFVIALAHERELRDQMTERLEEARKLHAVELARRLHELNNAHEQAMENWARSLPRELFDQWQKDYEKWRGEVGTQLTILASHPSLVVAQGAKLSELETNINALMPLSAHLLAVDARVVTLERLVSRTTGAVILLGFMGLAGVFALILGLARLAGATR